jgi:hypothetical protein
VVQPARLDLPRRDRTGREGRELGHRSRGADRAVAAGAAKYVLPAGLEVLVDGYRSKSGAPRANGKTLTFKDGRNFFLGASDNPADPGAPK